MYASIDAQTALISSTAEWRALREHVDAIDKTHLRDLIADAERCGDLVIETEGLYCDFARQRVTGETMNKLYDLARAAGVKEKINAMFSGEAINSTENRAVLHVATRAPRDKVINVDGKNVVPDVHDVLDKIKDFSERVRNGEWIGETGKPLKDVVAIGIGGSFLGPLFVHTSLRTNPEAAEQARGRQLRFLANVDPVDVARSLNGLDPETTLVVVVSKTFTTAETMLNARTVRAWIKASLGEAAVQKHMVAISTNLKLVEEFGIDPDNAFAFWDWVGGRYSVCSAVGMLPLSLQYGYDTMEQFLKGAWSMDQHFANAPFEENLPLTLGMLSVWNVSFLGCPARASSCRTAKRSPSSRRTFSKSPWSPTVRASPSTARRSITRRVRLTLVNRARTDSTRFTSSFTKAAPFRAISSASSSRNRASTSRVRSCLTTMN